MEVVEVDKIDTESLEGFLDRLADVCRVSADDFAGLRSNTELGSEEDLVPLASALEPSAGDRGQSINAAYIIGTSSTRTICR